MAAEAHASIISVNLPMFRTRVASTLRRRELARHTRPRRGDPQQVAYRLFPTRPQSRHDADSVTIQHLIRIHREAHDDSVAQPCLNAKVLESLRVRSCSRRHWRARRHSLTSSAVRRPRKVRFGVSSMLFIKAPDLWRSALPTALPPNMRN